MSFIRIIIIITNFNYSKTSLYYKSVSHYELWSNYYEIFMRILSEKVRH